MFSEILKIIPKLDNKDLEAMQKQLQGRFTKIAKSFGKGIKNLFTSGGLLGAAIALVDKILNPLKEVQEAIDRSLKTSDDIATNARQFETTTGKLFKLIQIGKATGLEQEGLFTLLTKFQGAVAQARNNPNDESVSAVRNFVDQKDTTEGFFNFIQSLQKMTKDQQVLVQTQIFGEKQILKMADFLQSDFPKLFKETRLDQVSSDTFGKSIDKQANLNDLADVLTVRRENTDVIAKGKTITEGMIMARDNSERIALQKENERIKSYNDLATINDTSMKIMGLVETGVAQLGKLISTLTPFMNTMVDAVGKFLKSPMVRGVKGFFGGKDE